MKRLSAFAVTLAPTLAFAQSSGKIEQGLGRALTWAAGIGIAFGAISLVIAGVKMSSGDPDSKERLKGSVIGSIIVLSAGTLMGLLKAWFS